ncbi:MAG TPA: hypothetical protein P5274_01140 [Candidatus Paceibacterota bacterium]|nr:hypothetical protein [Candidatus Paceibacterota bacterium]
MKKLVVLVFCAVVLSGLSVGCVSVAKSSPRALIVPELAEVILTETLEGVWTLKKPDTPTYEIISLVSGPSYPVETGVVRDFVFLVNPIVVGDKVYQDDETFFFRDQLKREVFPVFELKEGIRSYHIETNEGSSEEFIIEDDYDWDCQYGGEFPYIMGIPLEGRLKDGRTDRVYLVGSEGPSLEEAKGGWAHFFKREDLTLLNP